jgi:uncharacterized protein YbbC (DUF1343 family)
MTESLPMKETGIDVLLRDAERWLAQRRFGLIAHPASCTATGAHSAVALRRQSVGQLSALLGPEHGFRGTAGPGEAVADDQDDASALPIFSLYGDTRHTVAALEPLIDTLVFDLQDLSVRCYTYLHTLQQTMGWAVERGWRYIVADRPTPLADCVAGPIADPAWYSDVAPVALPLVYGMTPGETARWLCRYHGWELDLIVVPSPAATGRVWADDGERAWIAPSPAIRSLACAHAFPVTVFTEALPQLGCARSTAAAFQRLEADWLAVEPMCELLGAAQLPGMAFRVMGSGCLGLEITDAKRYQPVTAALWLLYGLQQCHPADLIWAHPQARPEWLDKLMGTDAVRVALQDGAMPDAIEATWQDGLVRFARERARARARAFGTVDDPDY